jgi:hypothetical protein
MSDSDPPPDSSGEPHGSEPPPSPRAKEGRRRRLEGVIPEIVKRAVELGVEKARESPETVKHFVGDLKLPKEIAQYLLGQIDETKNGLFRVVAKEIRDFLEQTNFAGEMQKLLTTVQFEVNTTIRFTPNDGKKKAKTKSKDDRRDDDGQRERDDRDRDERDDDASADDLAPSAPEVLADDPDGEGGESEHALPKPEVKTAVHVRRDDRDHDRRQRRPKGD